MLDLLDYIGLHLSQQVVNTWTKQDVRRVQKWALRKVSGKTASPPLVIVRALAVYPEAVLPKLPVEPARRETIVVWSLNRAQAVGKPVQKAEMYVSPMRCRSAS